jgi:hypothetical protein
VARKGARLGTIVGRPVLRKEGLAKVCGRARYIDDLTMPGMLYGATVRSSVALTAGPYRLHFETAEYFRRLGSSCFHPYIEIVFEVGDPAENYHIPLLLTSYAYSTYRGS